ncbi:sugar phosphorylase [Anaerobacillus alkalilacustris]|uniref:Sucrose phosphorylase n=1 Tax=Anaerobacillus alkalilacustris TaxID=393763 RepID=A0A1S2LY45_9BACI|nr:alpha-amylase family glycosyl hydrolase [Anaerobacillus alkalilacustris]OIJ17204.1 sugar phosphorylase [Anaerobacillus alkalilacustris]
MTAQNISMINEEGKKALKSKLQFVYDTKTADYLLKSIIKLMSDYEKLIPTQNKKEEFVSEKDTILITYGDSIKEAGKAPLQSLHEFLNESVKDTLTGVHILPFYPYSSDDGFSVKDYFAVNPELGNWEDIEKLSSDYELMFDGVINHISAKSEWFEEYLKGNPKYKNFFVEADPNADYSKVTRPRALPLLTKFETSEGTKYIWTTFSDDQIDLNYENPELVLKIVELLLFYISKGAKLIRLDAIGFMWKELGTTCIHLEQVHKLIQIFRDITDAIAPDTILITETNVPHKDNISYFGNGYNEARMVYQFPLPPLTLNSFLTGNANHLATWAHNLEETTEETTFFNFLASHDGVGVRPVEGILTKKEVEAMIDKVHEHGGNVSYKDNGDGTKSPYELNINYFDALSHPDDHQELKVKRFIAAQSVLLSMVGVPGIYIHSLLGSRNYYKGVEETGRFRSINREKLDRGVIEEELKDTSSIRYQVLSQMKQLIETRTQEKAFHPNSSQQVLFLNDHVFSFIRTNKDNPEEKIVVLVNVSDELQSLLLNLFENDMREKSVLTDLISGYKPSIQDGETKITLSPYQVMWLKG